MFLQRAPNHLSSRQRSWFLLLFLFHDSVSQAALSPGVPGLRHPQPCFSRDNFRRRSGRAQVLPFAALPVGKTIQRSDAKAVRHPCAALPFPASGTCRGRSRGDAASRRRFPPLAFEKNDVESRRGSPRPTPIIAHSSSSIIIISDRTR